MLGLACQGARGVSVMEPSQETVEGGCLGGAVKYRAP